MDLIQLLQALAQASADAQASAEKLGVDKFNEGAQSRQSEVDTLTAKVAELQAIVDAGPVNPNPDPLQAQLDAAIAQVADLTLQVQAKDQVIADKDKAFADFKSAELEKIKGVEVDFN